MPNVSTEYLVKIIGMSRHRFLYGLEQVPDDRLHWSPADGARTILQLCDYIAGFLTVVAMLTEQGAMPSQRPTPPPPSTSREEAVPRLERAYGAVQAAVSGVDEAALSKTLIPPWRTETTMEQMLWFLPTALGYYQGQLNLYQVCYGDVNPNMPPGWGAGNE